MNKITLNTTHAQKFIPQHDLAALLPTIKQNHQKLLAKKCLGQQFLGWLDLPHALAQSPLIAEINQTATKICQQSEVVIIIGIGGSYLGARAGIEFIHSPHYNQLPKNTPEIYFIGHHLSSNALAQLLTLIGDRDFSLNVISKSGTTLEPAVAFRFLKQLLIDKYGEKEAANRIYATTDAQAGALRQLALKHHYHIFTIPNDIGGRYSVLTPVGLLPLAIAGLNLTQLIDGALTAQQDLNQLTPTNIAWQYALHRYLFYRQEKYLEIMTNYEPQLHFFGNWWQQLFGESEGKDGQGLFPIVIDFTTDLHSLGQYLQAGKKHFFSTTLWLEKTHNELEIPSSDDNLDGLNYLAGRTMHYLNEQAFKGTIAAHTSGGAPNLIINLPAINEWQLGYLFYFFQLSCALSASLLDVNAFDQPGVEIYKKNMLNLLRQ